MGPLHSQTIIKPYVPLSWSLPQGGPFSVDDPCHSFILTWCWLQLDFLHLHFHTHNSLLAKEELCSSNAAHTFMPLVTLLSFSHLPTPLIHSSPTQHDCLELLTSTPVFLPGCCYLGTPQGALTHVLKLPSMTAHTAQHPAPTLLSSDSQAIAAAKGWMGGWKS